MVFKHLPFRARFFLTHLVISILIASFALGLVFFIWHPAPLAKAVGVTHIFLMMLTIDAILGPLLTLIVAKQSKKTLKFDLSVIALIQLSALIYGIYNIGITRPTYVAFDVMRFEVVQANMIPKQDKKQAIAPYNQINFLSPKWVAVKQATSDAEKNSRTFTELQTGIAPSMRPTLYEPLEKQWNVIQKNAQPLAQLYRFNNELNVDRVLQQYPLATKFLPLKAYEMDMTVLIDTKNQKIIKIVDLRPW